MHTSAARRPGPLFSVALAAISFLAPLAVHIFFPAMPAVRAAFAISDALAQATASVVLFTMALLTLVYGTLSDRYGRRPLLLTGIALFLLGTALSAAAWQIEALLAGRILQAVGAACGITLSRTMAHDVFPPDRLVRALAYLTMAYTLGPMIAPPLGGALVDLFGWRSVFALALGFGAAIALFAWFVAFETRPAHRTAVSLHRLLLGYRRLFANPSFCGYVFQMGFATGVFFTMAAGASFVMKDYLQRPATEYGLYFLCFPFGFFSGSFIAGRIGGRIRGEVMVLVGCLVLVAAAAAEAAFVLTDLLVPLTLFVPGFFVTFAQGLSLPSAQTGAMAIDRTLAGTASGIAVFMQFLFSAAMTQLFGLVSDGTPYPLMAIALVGSVAALAVGAIPYVRARRRAARVGRA
jgi:DHA1 family bicyclomycin/chloramphenicol resistance-like MFS transporter